MILEKINYNHAKNFAWKQAGVEFIKAFIVGGSACFIYLWFIAPA